MHFKRTNAFRHMLLYACVVWYGILVGGVGCGTWRSEAWWRCCPRLPTSLPGVSFKKARQMPNDDAIIISHHHKQVKTTTTTHHHQLQTFAAAASPSPSSLCNTICSTRPSTVQCHLHAVNDAITVMRLELARGAAIRHTMAIYIHVSSVNDAMVGNCV